MTELDLRAEPLANLRDVGGLPAADGTAVRPGLLFRSAGPHGLDAAAAADVAARLGLGVVVDLRNPDEREATPWPVLPDGVVVQVLPLLPPGPMPVFPEAFGEKEFGAWYAELASGGAAQLARIVRTLADPDCPPALVHCAAGKDRTGIVVACVLDLLGVAHDVIAADYHRTEDAIDAILALRPVVPSDIVPENLPPVVMRAPAGAMLGCLATVRDQHGGFRELLLRQGMTADDITRLRARMTM
ncbi:tyrosine-protein phosphatase [Streptomycetaceae bacterium NBC_01309]